MIDLSLHLLDLLQNCAHAGATEVKVSVNEERDLDVLWVRVTDNGRGMDSEERSRSLDPFFSTHPKRVGLGLPMVFQAARSAGGSASLRSEPGCGTEVLLQFKMSHPDRQPIGDLAATLVCFLAGNPGIRTLFSYRGHRGEYYFDSAQIVSDKERPDLAQVAFLSLVFNTLQDGLARAGFRPDGGGFAVEIQQGSGKNQRGDTG